MTVKKNSVKKSTRRTAKKQIVEVDRQQSGPPIPDVGASVGGRTLIESEEPYLLFEVILRSASDGILAVNRENAVLFANDRFVEMWQIPQELMDRRDDTLLLQYVLDQLSNPLDFLQKVQELYDSSEESFDTLYFKDGRIFDRLSRPMLQGKNLLGRAWSFRDITERKQMEDALVKERYEMQLLMNNLPTRIYFKDTASRFTRISKSEAELFDLSDPAQAIGKSDFDFFSEEHARQAYEDEQTIIRTGQPLSKEERETWADRPDRWVSTTKMPIRDNEGNIAGTFGISTDITERKHAEQALEERVKQLTALHEIAVTSTQVDSVDRLIESATEIIGRNIFPDNFGVLLMDEEKGVLRAHPSYQFISHEGRISNDIPLGQGVTGQVAQTGQPFRIGNIVGLKNYVNVDSLTVSEMCVPIKLKERILGVINAESTRSDAFTLDDELLLGTLAGQLATAIEQIRSVQAERQWLAQLAHSNELIYAVAQITTHIEKALTEEDIIQTLGRELSKINLTCCMAIYNQERRTFTINYTSIESQVLGRMENRIGFPLINHTFSLERLQAILNNENILHSAVLVDPEDEIQALFPRRRGTSLSEIVQEIGIKSGAETLRLPLVFEENLLGVLWVWGTDITKGDLPIMSIFAKHIGSSMERARLFQEVQSLALTDPLTGLQNRRSLFELGKIEFSRSIRMKRHFCCMMLDLDHFKQVNDTYGHPVGDQVLKEFAERCKCSVRDVDLIGRYGGEEILIFLPETDSNTALQVAERLRTSVGIRPMLVSGKEITVTVSIGVSGKDENTRELETLIARADQAMYIAKHKGRNCVAISK